MPSSGVTASRGWRSAALAAMRQPRRALIVLVPAASQSRFIVVSNGRTGAKSRFAAVRPTDQRSKSESRLPSPNCKSRSSSRRYGDVRIIRSNPTAPKDSVRRQHISESTQIKTATPATRAGPTGEIFLLQRQYCQSPNESDCMTEYQRAISEAQFSFMSRRCA